MPDENLRIITADLLQTMPPGAMPDDIARSLAAPTLAKLNAAGSALLAGGHLEAAESLFHAVQERFPDAGWASIGLARIAAARPDAAAALAAWQGCLQRLVNHPSEPNWRVQCAKAEQALGRDDDALNSLLECIIRFPGHAPARVARADLLLRLGRAAEAAATWFDAIENLADQADPSWYMRHAAALRAAGEGRAADGAIAAMAERFAEHPWARAERAAQAARDENWALALQLWTECIEREAEPRPEWLNGRALSLLRQFRDEDAMAAWQDLAERFPAYIPGFVTRANGWLELGRHAEAQRCWFEIIRRWPEHLRPDWLAALARARIGQQRSEAAAPVIEELDRLFPQSPLGRLAAVELALRVKMGLPALIAILEDARRRFPSERSLMFRHAEALLAQSRFDDVESLVASLEAGGDDHHARVSRWLLRIDREGQDAIRQSATASVRKHKWNLAAGLGISTFLLVDIVFPWGAELALELFEDLVKRFPGRPAIICGMARALITLRRSQAALAVIDLLPPLCRLQHAMELRAWAAAQRGEHEQSRRIWTALLTHTYFASVHGPDGNLELLTPERTSWPAQTVHAFVLARDEMANLPEFMRHHRSIGIGRFVFVDHMSSDGTAAFLAAQPDVMLYRTADDWHRSNSGMRWVNALIGRHGGAWNVKLDADERFIYPGWENLPVARLVQYLEAEGAEAIATYMLDLYPERLLDASGRPAGIAEYRYYDSNYVWVGNVRAPFLRPLGGVRLRLFQAHEQLHKTPLIRAGRGVHLDSHDATPLKFSAVSAVLLHYKYRDLAERWAARHFAGGNVSFNRAGAPRTLRRYERYAAHLASIVDMDLRQSGITQALTGSLELADRGLMQAPLEFREWLNNSRHYTNPR